MNKKFEKLRGIDEVRNLIRNFVTLPIEAESVNLEDSRGRMLLSDVFAPKDSPILPKSAMDGFAVRSIDIKEASIENFVELSISGEVRLGEFPGDHHGDQICVRIPTGGYVPDSFDSVVPVELVTETKGKIRITGYFEAGTNIDRKGSDYKEREVLLKKERVIGSKDVGVLASIGMKNVEVLKRIRVAVSPTGNELIPPGQTDSAFVVYDSNSWGIKAALEETGQFTVKHYGILPDDEKLISETMNEMLKENEIIITNGGTSMGEKDFVREVLKGYKPGIIFHGIDTKPGMPTLLAVAGGKPVIGLPGPPVSAMMVLYDIFIPGLLEKLGMKGIPVKMHARLTEKTKISRGKYNLIPVSLKYDGELFATPLPGGSATITRLSRAQGYFAHPGDANFLEAGTEVTVMPFSRLPL